MRSASSSPSPRIGRLSASTLPLDESFDQLAHPSSIPGNPNAFGPPYDLVPPPCSRPHTSNIPRGLYPAPATPRSPASVHKVWNSHSESFVHEAPDGSRWSERDVVRMVWSSLKGTYEYEAMDGTRWDDRNLEATQTSARHLADPSAWMSAESARGAAGGLRLPKYVIAMMKEEARRAKAEVGVNSPAFEKAKSGLRRKLAGSLRKMLSLFEKWDVDQSGTVDKHEFRRAVAGVGYAPKVAPMSRTGWGAGDVVDAVFKEYDKDKSGEISYKEYVRFSLRSGLQRQMGRVMDLFRTWDVDGTGTIDRAEWYKAVRGVGFDAPVAELDGMFDEVDSDGSGYVSLTELNALLRQGASVQIDPLLQAGAKGEIAVDAKNKYAIRKDKNARTGPLRAATVDELRKALASRAQRAIDLFRAFDKNGDGVVAKSEFRAVLPMIGFDASAKDAIDALFDTFDVDGSGKIDFDELHKLLRQGASVVLDKELRDGAQGEIELDRKNKIAIRTEIDERKELKPVESVAQLRAALLDGWTRVIDVFRQLDRDSSGGVSKAEFRSALPLLGFDSSDSAMIDALFEELDVDHGGSLEYGEVFSKLERYDGWDQGNSPYRPAEEIAGEKMKLERGMGALAEEQKIWHG